jgi:hypothetical protein
MGSIFVTSNIASGGMRLIVNARLRKTFGKILLAPSKTPTALARQMNINDNPSGPSFTTNQPSHQGRRQTITYLNTSSDNSPSLHIKKEQQSELWIPSISLVG